MLYAADRARLTAVIEGDAVLSSAASHQRRQVHRPVFFHLLQAINADTSIGL